MATRRLVEGMPVVEELSTTTAGTEASASHAAHESKLLTKACPWLRPATSAPKLASLKLRWAYLIHVLAGIMFFFVFLLWVQIDFWTSGSLSNVFLELVDAFVQHWEEASLITLFTVLCIEAGFVAMALVFLPWGAADEPLRSSWAHVLRFTWLHTTHALALLLMIGPAVLLLNHMSRLCYQTYPPYRFDVTYPPYPSFPTNATPGSQAMKDFEVALAQYEQEVEELTGKWQLQYQEWRSRLPFLVRHNEAIIAFLCTVGSAWFLWALLRAIGAKRTIASVQRPPTCEYCGYNLTGTAIERQCPECGTPTIESLGPQVRPGTEWERGGGLKTWWRCAITAIRDPSMLGRQIQVTTQPRRFRWFSWSLILPAGVVGAITVPVAYVLAFHRNPISYEPETITIGMPVLGATSGAGMLMLATLIASVVGMIQTWQNKRNLLPAAAQMSAYLSLLFLGWGLFMAVWFTLFAVAVQQEWFIAWLMTWGPSVAMWLFGILIFPQLVWLAVCLMFVWKGTAAARYANR